MNQSLFSAVAAPLGQPGKPWRIPTGKCGMQSTNASTASRAPLTSRGTTSVRMGMAGRYLATTCVCWGSKGDVSDRGDCYSNSRNR